MRISVVIPLFGAHDWIDEAVRSVLAQSKKADEIIIVDDASPTPLQAGTFKWPEVVSIHRMPRNGGVGAARKLGSELASGDVVAFLDADDWWDPSMLKEVEGALESDDQADGCITGITIVTRGQPARAHSQKPALLSTRDLIVPPTSWVPSCLSVRRTFLMRLGNWSPDRTLMEDYDLSIRIAVAGGKIVGISKPLMYFRRFEHGNLSQAHWDMLLKSVRTIYLHSASIRRALGPTMPLRLYAATFRDRGVKQGGVAGRVLRLCGSLIPKP